MATSDIYVEEIVSNSLYRVMKDGSIWTRIDRSGYARTEFRRIDKLDRDGYHRVNYKHRKLYAHRIVYRALIGEIDATLVVNHIDGNKANNRPENLELVSQSHNNKHAQRLHGGFGRTKQSPYHLRAALIRALRDLGASHRDTAMALGLSTSFVSQVVSGEVFPPTDRCAVDHRKITELILRLR